MGNLMEKLAVSCKKATELMEKKLHFSLSLRERISLILHKTACDACKQYDKQSLLIHKKMSSEDLIQKNEISVDKINELQQRIIHSIIHNKH